MANFPDSPGIGSVFVDTTSGFQYKWTGVVWKSFTAAAAENISELDDISSGFNNSTTTFNLTTNSVAFTPQSAAQMQISLGGVIQEPGTDYTIDGSTITFTTAPNAGLDFFGVVRGTAVAIDYANDGNVQTKQEFTATEGQTSFTITGGYTAGFIDVFRNGVRLAADDITISSGTAVVLTTPAQAGDIIETVKYEVASIVVSEGQFTNLNISGIATVGVLTGATSIQSGVFYGDGSGLTGVASTDNIQTATPAKFLNDVSITGVTTVGVVTGGTSISAGVYYGDGSALTGIDASTLKSGSDIKAQAVGTGVVVTGVLTATSAVFDGNVTVGGTITYQDATSIDVLGIGTFQQGIQVLANGANVTGIVTVGVTTIKSGEIEVVGVVTATTFVGELNSATLDTVDGGAVVTGFATATGFKVGAAISITDGAISATRFHGSGADLTGISVGITTEEITATDRTIATLNLSKDAHKVNVSGVATIDCQGGSEYETHILTIVNTGIATVGFSTYFLFPSGSEPSLPTASGTISQLSFTVHRVGAAGTQVLTTAALNFS